MAAFPTQTLVSYTALDAQTASPVQQKLLAFYESNSFYDAAAVADFEVYLAEQISASTIDIDANLALLKLYSLFPEHLDVDKVAKVLVKGIQALPSTFFTGASTVVPESIREDANVKAVLEAGFLLQSCLFEEFWQVDLTYAKSVAGFTDAARAFILDAVRKSHSAISTSVLKAKLNISDKEVQDVVAAEKWSVEGDVIKITLNEDNQVRPKKIQENIEFEDVLKVIHTLSR
uniref:Eukaryotic translation initiation factor 3 subunit K n=1 Tax=Globisporangium ultimum (strain ATCC 200006 / CBS 805.95 / DAOM BR144) TaxID=431595 RepID=K3WRP7_GLOUD